MCAPVVGLIHVGHCGSQATFSHHGVGLAEQRFADHSHARALRQSLDCGSESSAARTNDEDVVFVSFVLGGHRIRMSFNAPEATKRIYKSVRPTEIMLTQAQNMWCSLSLVMPRQADSRGGPSVAHEKQSSFPPTRCRSEWHDRL